MYNGRVITANSKRQAIHKVVGESMRTVAVDKILDEFGEKENVAVFNHKNTYDYFDANNVAMRVYPATMSSSIYVGSLIINISDVRYNKSKDEDFIKTVVKGAFKSLNKATMSFRFNSYGFVCFQMIFSKKLTMQEAQNGVDRISAYIV